MFARRRRRFGTADTSGRRWRIYFTQRGREIIVLLAGGSKRTQKADIKRAKVLAGLLDGEESDHE
jgi:putative addiction module killer protein